MQEHDIIQLMAELGFDTNDQQTKAMLTQLLNVKPNAVISADFKQQLRSDLKNHIAAQSLRAPIASPTSHSTINIITIMSKFMVPALVVVVLIVAGGVWYTNQNQGLINLGGSGQLLSGSYSVDPVAANSFGDLSKVAITNAGERSQGAGGNAATGLGAGGDTAVVAESDKMAAPGIGGSGGGGDVGIMPPVPGTNFTFNYKGDLPELAANQDVLKRVKPEQNSSLVSRIISFFSFGLIDLSKFTDTKIQNFSFVEDKEYGLGVNVDLTYGNISVYQNWEKWPQPEYRCDEKYCGSIPRITEKDLPSADEAIAIANQFVSDYGVSLDGFGSPSLFEPYPWRIEYERTEDKSRFYFPEQVTVLYPLVLEGQSVYDEGGNPMGMMVNIDVRTRKVNNVYGLDSKQFQKSPYVGETDEKRIRDIVKRGGYSNGWFWGGSDNGGTTTIELDAPSIQLIRMWYSTEPNKQGEELYVPSLVFPIKNAGQNTYWRKNVVVPLVKDILDNENRGGGPIPLDQPVAEPIPVEPDNGIGDTPDAPVSTEPSTSTSAQ